MSTAARKTRKRLRREALNLGLIDIAERLRFVHPTKTGTVGRRRSDRIIDRDTISAPGWFRRLFGRGIRAVTA